MMKSQDIHIDLAQIDSYGTLILLFDKVDTFGEQDYVRLYLDFTGKGLFVHSDHLLAIVAMVFYLRRRGATVDIEVKGECDYASRVNFFQLLGLPYEENFKRKGNVGRFIELSKFTNDTTYPLQDHLTMLLHQLPIAIEVKQLMFYCLGEIMDNVLVHSCRDHGWVCAQFYPNRQEIRLMICDIGVGVLDALRNGERDDYRNIDEIEALSLCVQRGVTNGRGLGFGLYATSRFIQLNKGEMLLYSGHHYLEIKGNQSIVNEGSYWPGTIVAMRIRTDIPVDYQDIMPAHHTLPDDYQFFIDKFFGENNELW